MRDLLPEAVAGIKPALHAFLLLCLISCAPASRRTPAQSIGAQSEVLVVTDRSVRQSDLQDSLDLLVTGPTPGLNQNEPFFRPIRLLSADLRGRYTLLHSILRVALNPKAAPSLTTARDQWARPQTVVQVVAPTLAALRPFLAQHSDTIRDLLLDGQLNAAASNLKRRHSATASRAMRRIFGLDVCLPPDLHFVKTGRDFLWASDRLPERSLNFVAYALPLAPDTLFAHLRDSVMRQNIPGATPSQWMTTTRLDGRPMVSLRPRAGYTEARGLWEMHDGPMGGPFVAYLRRDLLPGRLLVVEAFVYSPSTDKRDLLRAIEAALRTVSR